MNPFSYRFPYLPCLLTICLTLSALPAAALEKVTLQLKGSHAFQFAGYYAAKELGYYREAGLDVTIEAAAPETDPVNTILGGKAQYGVGTSGLLLARSAGKPVVVLAVVFQQSPYEIFAAPGIRSLQDLIGKRLMLEPQSEELLAYLKKEDIPLDRIQFMPHTFDAAGLMQGKSEAISGYISNEPYYFKQAHYAYQTFSPRSVGIDFYGDNLFTSERELRDHPRRVKAFRTASLRGWQYAKGHHEEVIDLIITKYSHQHSHDYLHYEAEQMIPLLQPNLIEIGYMNPDRWRHIADTYAGIGLLPADYSLEGFLYRADERDMTWYYRVLGSTIVLVFAIGGVAIYVLRVNRQLAQVMAKINQTSAALIESEELWRSTVKASPDGITITSMEGTVQQVSDKLLAMFGYNAAEEVVGRNIFEFIDPAYHDKATSMIGDMLAGTYNGAADYQMIRKDNSRFYAEANSEVLRDRDGRPRGLIFIDRDISERKRIETTLRSLSVAIEQSPVSVVITDNEAVIEYVNPRFSEVTGYSAAEVNGQNTRILNSGLTERAVFDSMWSALRQGHAWTGEFINKRKNGEQFHEEAHISPVYDSNGNVTQYVAVKLDITERKLAEQRITHMALHDTLTDLPNRALFSSLLQQVLALAQRDGSRVALMFVDLDRFKPVNDTYGHAVGDLLLKEAAQRMRHSMRTSDTLGRIGGDEFVVLLPRVDNESDAMLVGEKMRQALATPFVLGGYDLNISASIGISIYPDHGTDEKQLSQHADTAMYCAKQGGRNSVQMFREQMHKQDN